ncbi:unnamed protein product [Clonostachys rosea]|uniref:Major facilitator superfamily (MFS) profile domain-containing protein n=1 Tax=Bionectria ochroleuca TaxID=29856 RepID=A0ABY6TNE5_BIOOC|nr:unnamed protein product [Clonostachys rosea]
MAADSEKEVMPTEANQKEKEAVSLRDSPQEQQHIAPNPVIEKLIAEEYTAKPASTKQPDSENVTIVNDDETPQPSSEEGDVEKQRLPSREGDEINDPNIVSWDGDDDPANPYNWKSWRKVVNCILISALSFLTPLAMFAPGVTDLMKEFQMTSRSLGSFVVSVYVLGFAAGPMIFAPLSEIYGRGVVYHSTNLCFLAFTIACAVAPTFSSLVGFRFLAGLFGSVPLTNGGGSIADMIHQEKRGAAMSAFAVGPLLGPIIGPVVGGYVSEALGWRWVFWILSCLSGFITITFFVFSAETYAPVLLERKTKKLRKETGNMNLRSKLDEGLLPKDYFVRGIVRPFKMLFFSPICIIAALYVALGYGYLYLMFSSLSPLIQQIYHFGTGAAGLAFLGFGVGSMIGVIFFARLSDIYIKKKAKEEAELAQAEGREPAGLKPEYRLPPLRFGALLLPIGLFIYGWTAYYKVHWIAPIIGTAVMGAGNLMIFMASFTPKLAFINQKLTSFQMYLVDTFAQYSASALASNSVVRSILGAVLPLAAFPMYDKLGLGWGNSLLGFIAAALIPVPWLVLKYGEYLRKRFEIKNL